MEEKIVGAIKEVTDGDESFIEELVGAFITNFEEIRSSIPEIVDKRDTGAYRAIVHKVKPSFLTISLEDEFKKIDEFGKDLDARTSGEIEEFRLWAKSFTDEVLEILKKI